AHGDLPGRGHLTPRETRVSARDMSSTALDRDARPMRSQRAGQSRIPIDDGQDRPRQGTGGETRYDVGPARGAFFTDQPHVEDHALAVGPHAQGHQHRYALAAPADADLRIP